MRAGRLMPLLAALLVVAGCGANSDPHVTSPATTRAKVAHTVVRQWHLAGHVTGRLPAPLQDAAPAAVGDRKSVV